MGQSEQEDREKRQGARQVSVQCYYSRGCICPLQLSLCGGEDIERAMSAQLQ